MMVVKPGRISKTTSSVSLRAVGDFAGVDVHVLFPSDLPQLSTDCGGTFVGTGDWCLTVGYDITLYSERRAVLPYALATVCKDRW